MHLIKIARFLAIGHTEVIEISIQNWTCALLIISIFFCTSVAVIGSVFSSMSQSTYAQIEVTTDQKHSPPISNRTVSEDAEPKPHILYSALNSDTIVGEVLNNFTYPIELVRITASVYDKNDLLAATGDSYTSDYWLKPGTRSGFDIFLDEKLPTNSNYTLTISFEKSDEDKPEALQLIIGRNSKGSGNFKVLGEVINQGELKANSVKVSGIFYDKDHKVIDVDYKYTNPDIINPKKKAPFELSFYADNSDKTKSMAINAQSDEYSLITNNNQNKTKPGP